MAYGKEGVIPGAAQIVTWLHGRSALVRSGKYRPEELSGDVTPDAVVDSIANLSAEWQHSVAESGSALPSCPPYVFGDNRQIAQEPHQHARPQRPLRRIRNFSAIICYLLRRGGFYIETRPVRKSAEMR